jgi:hypothetical protein
VQATLAGDTAYPNPAGYPLTPDAFGLRVIRKIVSVRPANVASGAWVPVIETTLNQDFSVATAAIKLLVATTAVQVANGVNVSASSFIVVVEGD